MFIVDQAIPSSSTAPSSVSRSDLLLTVARTRRTVLSWTLTRDAAGRKRFASEPEPAIFGEL